MTLRQKRMLFATIALIFAIAMFIAINTRYHITDILQYKGAPVYSPQDVVGGLWENYKHDYLENETFRTLDRDLDNITTSEGQSYTMLRAVWMDDKQTFDEAWRWTKDNLRRDGDEYLFSWIFGKRDDGSYGVLDEQGGYNTASDADTDIALSLVLAYSRWQDPRYLAEAREVITDIWEKEVVHINDTPYLTISDLEILLDKEYVLLNPSYFAPYAYKIFDRVDENPEHDWLALAESSYNVIERSMELPLDANRSAGIPPNWIEIDITTGELSPPRNTELTTDYGFEALRIPWRLALDWQWFEDQQAKELLEEMSFFADEWRTEKRLYAEYAHNGSVVSTYESASMYAGTLGYFIVIEPRYAREIYTEKIISRYNPTWFNWEDQPGYYATNWRWFSIGLYNDLLPNYASLVTEFPSSSL